MNPRPILGSVLALLGVVVAVAIFAPDQEAAAEPRQFSSSRECAECHAEAYGEWSVTEHASAWTGAEVRALSNDFSNQDCIDCHAPKPVFETGIGNRVQPRTLNRVEGVDCLTCHQLPGGGVAGSTNDSNAACRPQERRELTSPNLCGGCHNQHKTVDQWRGSKWAEQGIDCIDCHMPFRDGDPSKGRDHSMHGGSSLDNLHKAVELRGMLEDGHWVVEVENVGTGHSFPADERSRAADVFWRPLDDNGAGVGAWRHLHRFRSPYRQEADLEDTLLLVHENRRMPVLESDVTFIGSGGLSEGTPVSGPIEVALFYKRKPYYTNQDQPDPEAEATLVHRIELIP
ncbi:multiheme c-type cytochrome [Engelhardtia mirabilis]|uniref:Cytochrome c-552/4 domain-containing protein n=1 Tax=Engelhardtia mirabilis TaxID=2528011 RepID=A0A518BLP8_9BACT|nr:hypothetical protein Pla133_29830 [Planctomycetes bacterium Pla133]QDV02220.1 hypothetical protein Pla86_29820 [Planctomycetes bacterium Pla86]